MEECERCHDETHVLTMSFFNTQMICLGCEEREQVHPEYEMAKVKELEAVKSGDHHFLGIGLPNDLV